MVTLDTMYTVAFIALSGVSIFFFWGTVRLLNWGIRKALVVKQEVRDEQTV